ncbi:lipocalin-like domain-containing protein [Xylophilus ampelinus]|uniref:Putative secreted hydrolase n=1 Tax=Xylophilus ampelinus TaxID=54067 RepID=A0A318SKZ1_9BURK|nr:lipocalin-like domain-containing protein [Xylophilus ampelinus]MCS4510839.1 carotenoid 1,2-hydratase [Xylophilus ampelinus]PYE76182.1 putative secreted hydrolase [Xylophilus ampelinus]
MDDAFDRWSGAGLSRRAWLALAGAATLPGPARAQAPDGLALPRDLGSHDDFQTEWWYVTGHARSAGRDFGFQVTFFRRRVAETAGLSSRFAARQLLFAHGALSDLRGRRLWHDQRIARWSGRPMDAPGSADTADASAADTAVRIGDWSLVREPGAAGGARYRARVRNADFALDLDLRETQPLLLQGDSVLQGDSAVSRKGPEAAQVSYYYTVPQLAVTGSVQLGRERFALETPTARSGAAWLDHEWSESPMHPDVVGWDWLGINLIDGSALTAFRLRRADGSALWAGGSFRVAGGTVQRFANDAVRFAAGRTWRSPQTGARYPMVWDIATPAGAFTLHTLMDEQELDSRGSTGAVYWEGLSELRDAAGTPRGRGYLEMTGYVAPLRL